MAMISAAEAGTQPHPGRLRSACGRRTGRNSGGRVAIALRRAVIVDRCSRSCFACAVRERAEDAIEAASRASCSRSPNARSLGKRRYDSRCDFSHERRWESCACCALMASRRVSISRIFLSNSSTDMLSPCHVSVSGCCPIPVQRQRSPCHPPLVHSPRIHPFASSTGWSSRRFAKSIYLGSK